MQRDLPSKEKYQQWCSAPAGGSSELLRSRTCGSKEPSHPPLAYCPFSVAGKSRVLVLRQGLGWGKSSVVFQPFSQSWLREALDKGPKVSCSRGQNTKFPPISYPTWFSFFRRYYLGPLLCARGYPRSTGGKVCKLAEGSLVNSYAW